MGQASVVQHGEVRRGCMGQWDVCMGQWDVWDVWDVWMGQWDVFFVLSIFTVLLSYSCVPYVPLSHATPRIQHCAPRTHALQKTDPLRERGNSFADISALVWRIAELEL